MNFEALKNAAEAGQVNAQMQLGIAFLTGEGVPQQDAAAGRDWLARAAGGGQPAAARFLGLIWLRGMDVAPDADRGTALLTQAAESGDAEAAWFLASFLGGARDARFDESVPRQWLCFAAEKGHARAMTHLAFLLDQENGSGTENPAPAEWMLKAAIAGDPGAYLALAEWCSWGRYFPMDKDRANWLALEASLKGWEVADELCVNTPHPAGATSGLPDAASIKSSHAGKAPATELTVLAWQPRAILLRQFLTAFECAEIANAAKEHLMPSFIVNADGELGTNDIRSSHEVRLRPGLRNMVINAVEQRMAAWSHQPVSHGEFPLVLRYEKHQSFEQHYDYFIPENFVMGEGPLELGGQRVATQLVYLNDHFAGGETRFDHVDTVIRPERGMCLLFYNVSPDHNVDPLTRHTGTAVTSGVKWLLSRWIRELPFDQAASGHARDCYRK